MLGRPASEGETAIPYVRKLLLPWERSKENAFRSCHSAESGSRVVFELPADRPVQAKSNTGQSLSKHRRCHIRSKIAKCGLRGRTLKRLHFLALVVSQLATSLSACAGPQVLGRVDHAAGCSSSKALRKKAIASSASCGLVWRIYQVAGEDGMRCLSPRPHAGGVGGVVGQFRAGERGSQGGAQGLETRGPADSVAFEPIAAQFQPIASARLHSV